MGEASKSFLTNVPPMGIYETLYAFQDAFGTYMGNKGTHPWSQGFPLTTQLPGGPEMPENIYVNAEDLKYPVHGDRNLVMLSNPCNPTGVTRTGDELQSLVNKASYGSFGLLIDEAYELFHNPPTSALEFIDDINDSNLFISGAATKGLQAPGIRIGWIVAAKRYIEILGNYSSFGMGGVSRPSQLYALELLQQVRTDMSRRAVPTFYASQRKRYGEAFTDLGIQLFSGDGGFYHWCMLPGELTAEEFNNRLFKHGAAILKGTDCDMKRQGDKSPLSQFFRFSFGPLQPESFKSDIKILRKVLY